MACAAVEDIPLPALRQELRIERGAPLTTGAPSWTLFDPVKQAFYQLGKLEFRIFALWRAGSLNHVRAGLAADGLDDQTSDKAIGRVLDFAFANSLTLLPNGPTVETFTKQRAARRREWWKWLVDNYLFIRIPLVKPDAFLKRTLPIVAPLWSRASVMTFVIMTIVGLFLVARQWDAFVASFLYFFNLQGLMAYGLALGLVKIIHELGHAYTARRFGVRVPTMGISLLVMMPVLYTDTTAAWRLTSRRQRMLIDSAGVGAEMMVAAVATLLWSFLPDGSLRSGLFVLSTTSWVTSLAINLSPFMRYDGYYILSDAIGVPNLQPRSFAIARWRLRELLFGLGEDPPEAMPRRLELGLTIYAWLTWFYRFILFLGIALLVYHMFFKVLGIILFAVEMVVFIGRPIFNELSAWYARKEAIMVTRRAKITGGIALAALIACILPIDRSVSAPAVLSPIGNTPLVSGDPAQIVRILAKNGDRVAAGAPIAELAIPDLDRETAMRKVEIARLSAQLDRAQSDALDLSNRAVIERQLAAARDALAGIDLRRSKLVLRAPTAGTVVDLGRDMHAGRWLGGAEVVARIVTPGDFDVEAYVGEGDVWRIAPGAQARFVPDDASAASRPARIAEVASSAASKIDLPVLASVNGGPIAVATNGGTTLKPRETMFHVRLIAAKDAETSGMTVQPVRGTIMVSASGQSVVSRLANWVSRTLAREWSLSQ